MEQGKSLKKKPDLNSRGPSVLQREEFAAYDLNKTVRTVRRYRRLDQKLKNLQALCNFRHKIVREWHEAIDSHDSLKEILNVVIVTFEPFVREEILIEILEMVQRNQLGPFQRGAD